MSEQQTAEVVIEKSKIYKTEKEPNSDRLDDFKRELDNFPLWDIAESLADGLEVESIDDIDDRLHRKVSEVKQLVITEQESREL